MRGLLVAAAAAVALLTLVPGASAQDPYHTYQGMKQDTRTLAEEHPDVAEFRIVGQSVAGQEIFAVDVAQDIGNLTDEELASLPAMYVDGGHHGNEILSMEAAYHFLEDVLEAAGNDSSVLGGKRLVVTPIVNPDGRVRDQRQNTDGVDLNRNYPFHWGRYGTSPVPGHPTYRGPAPASEPETQANIELMREMDMEAYLSGHTGTYDIVLPWRESEDGEIPDWPMYEATLGAIENETGLEYRDPSGAGESTAWGYGNRTALSLVMEVSEEQNAPASRQDVEDRLDEPLQAYHLVWENLTHIHGSLHVEEVTQDTVTVLNDGWAPAYNVTVSAGTLDAGEGPVVDSVDEIGAGETATLNLTSAATAIAYQETKLRGEDPPQSVETLSIPEPEQTGTDVSGDDGGLPVPAPGALGGLAAALAGAALRRRA
jgi:hypothetical protein